MRSLAGPIVKSIVFIAVTVLSTTLLALTIANGSQNGGKHYSAVFSDVTSLNVGDDVRMAGVRVGQVSSIDIYRRREAKVGFDVDSDVRLARTVTATIRYRNLIGQRYVALDEGSGSLADPLPSGATIRRTFPALDLTALFNGFQPLFEALSPKDVNALSGEIVQVFQGEGGTIEDLLQETAQFTNALAQKDAVIGQVIDNLHAVLSTVQSHGGQLTALVSSLQQLVSGLAADRAPLGDAITGVANLSTDVAGLLQDGRAPLHSSIVALQALSQNLAGSSGALNSFLQVLPGKLTKLGRLASYGSWVNFYVCSISGRIPVPSDYGNVAFDPAKNAAVGPPDATGAVGVNPVALRCRG